MHVDAVQDIFGTTEITAGDWLVTIAVASTVLWFEEARKAVARRTARAGGYIRP